ncbi:MAG: AMP-binding protein [Curvibacter sp. RIFCSPHIGHO2_12_FULL_63_18]|uniref:acyl-CoA synthetase n=1 Tax=Rhodoferax sp. TaxID=50421 RepID=UPI0008D3FE86|nr:AMP-binding protein [Rhodoferax sp.]OGO95721.1 MAG: AMP-binding protein [Curvibacter sp. GWA2_63_95]OGO99970.1 MAG: AMP-binding protein [Curvibacter sp. RIFCSPHIGHO2_12_FULL_63_18]HCX81937.1 AMP-binding protein [Rhodoferax sp.]
MPVSQGRDTTPRPRRAAPPAAYAALHQGFGWQVPTHFNMAQACSQRWVALPDATKRIAVRAYSTGAESTFYTYFELQAQANRLSNVLRTLGVQRGDRVGIVLPQRFETAVAYMAVLQLGAVAMPLSMLFGPEALQFRLHDSEAVVAIGDASALDALNTVRDDCPLLRTVIGVGTPGTADVHWADVLAQAPASFTPVDTLAEEPAVLIYTSGTTGNPKGALIPHRALIGNLSGFVASQNWFGFDGKKNATSKAVFWSPADWAWTGGLMDALLPTLYFGRPIVAYSGRFSPQTALELMRDCGVTHTFLFPTALKAMMKAYPGTKGKTVRQQFQLQLDAIMSAGEAVGDAVFGYCATQLGVPPNEMFGQTEMNYIVGNCNLRYPSKPGSMGMGYPGHRVAVIDDEGKECAVGVPGDVALHRLDVHGQPDPIFFLGYWKNPAATAAKFTGDWCRTGDLAVRDADGYLWYQGRSDDVFKAAGYRIGPGEIENCLVKHPAVINAAVVPKPDAERGALVKAYVVIAPDFIAACAGNTGATAQLHAKLTAELQAHVKGQLAPYEYPKEIEFVDALPMTTTGKVQRRVLRLQEEARYAAARR